LEKDARHRCLAFVYHDLSRRPDAEHELKDFQALNGDSSAYDYAKIYAQWGDPVSALQWLRKAEKLRVPALQLLRVDGDLDPIRNEPEFKAILARMNFPPQIGNILLAFCGR
jgi:hypothetical protein